MGEGRVTCSDKRGLTPWWHEKGGDADKMAPRCLKKKRKEKRILVGEKPAGLGDRQER